MDEIKNGKCKNGNNSTNPISRVMLGHGGCKKLFDGAKRFLGGLGGLQHIILSLLDDSRGMADIPMADPPSIFFTST